MKSHPASRLQLKTNKPPHLNLPSKAARRLFSLLALLTFGGLTSSSLSQTIYTWTGATSGDWSDASNWDTNGVPVDNNAGTGNDAGLTFPTDGSMIVFDGGTNPLPTSNIPDLGGNVNPRDTPAIVINQGGTIEFNLGGREGDVWSNAAGTRNILTVGDGMGAAGEVTVTLSSNDAAPILARHTDNTLNNFQVNADGVLNFSSETIDFGWMAGNRHGKLTIDGGQVNLRGVVDDLTTFTQRVIEFTAVGGSFTAQFGGDFPDISAVNSSLEVDFTNSPGITLEAADNGDSFTVRAIEGLDPNYWTGTGGSTWDETPTLNFTTNQEALPLVVDTFDNAKAIQRRVTFADQYFDSGVPQMVLQNSVSIAVGGVSTNNVEFTNSDIRYEVSALDGRGIAGDTRVNISGGGGVFFNSPNTYGGFTSLTGGSILILGDSLALQNSTLLGSESPLFDQSVSSNSFTLGGLASDASIILENNANSPAAIELVVGNNDTDTSYSQELSGSGGLTKIGTGTLTLDDPGADNSFTGDTLIREGRIIAGPGNSDIGLSTASSVFLGDPDGSADVTLQFDVRSSTTFPASITYTAQSGNTGTVRLHNSGNTQIAGDVFLGSPNSTGKGITIEALGPTTVWDFRFQGVIQDPVGLVGTPGDVTVGSNNIAEVRFEGTHTYSGNTLVESGGKFFLVDGGTMTFYPTVNGTTNQLRGGTPSGTGTVDLNSSITLDLDGADQTLGNMWPLIVDTDLASVTYSPNFGLNSTLGLFAETSADSGVWTLPVGANFFTFSEATGILQLSDAASTPYLTWANSFGLSGADAMQSEDPDRDSLSNLYEFGIGTSPRVADLGPIIWDGVSAIATAGCPIINIDNTITARFMRRKDHGTAGSISYTWEFSSDLTDWESSDNAAWSTAPTDLADDASGDYDLVEVPFPSNLDSGPEPRFFRLTINAL